MQFGGDKARLKETLLRKQSDKGSDEDYRAWTSGICRQCST